LGVLALGVGGVSSDKRCITDRKCRAVQQGTGS
jgi:hypothetical protein